MATGCINSVGWRVRVLSRFGSLAVPLENDAARIISGVIAAHGRLLVQPSANDG